MAISEGTKAGKMEGNRGENAFSRTPTIANTCAARKLNWRHLINPPVQQQRGPLNPCRTRRPHDDYDGDGIGVSLSRSLHQSQFRRGYGDGICLDLVKSGSYFYALLIDSRLEHHPCLTLTSYFMFMNAFLLWFQLFLLPFLGICCWAWYNFHGSTLWSLIFTREKFTTITASVGGKTKRSEGMGVGQLNWGKANKSRTSR